MLFYLKENKNNRRRAANSEAPVAVFLFMTIECSQSVHSIVSSENASYEIKTRYGDAHSAQG